MVSEQKTPDNPLDLNHQTKTPWTKTSAKSLAIFVWGLFLGGGGLSWFFLSENSDTWPYHGLLPEKDFYTGNTFEYAYILFGCILCFTYF